MAKIVTKTFKCSFDDKERDGIKLGDIEATQTEELGDIGSDDVLHKSREIGDYNTGRISMAKMLNAGQESFLLELKFLEA